MSSRSIRFLTIAIVAAAIVTFVLLRNGSIKPAQQAEEPSSPAVTLPDLPLLSELAVAADSYEFVGSELRSALVDLCEEEARPPQPEPNPDDIQAQIDELDVLRRNLLRQLKSSPSSEHLLFSTFLEKNPLQKIALIQSALLQNPNDALLLWRAVQICSENADLTGCPLHEWEQRLSDLDGHNSETWIRIAANRYREGNEGAAIEALRRAATSASTSIFWTETIAMSERSLSATIDLAFAERALMAFGLAAANLPKYGDYVNMCEKQSAEISDWTFACLEYGQLAENQARTDMGVLIALTIQRITLTALGDDRAAAAATARYEEYRKQKQDFASANNLAVTEQLVLSSPSLFSSYLEMINLHGESGARTYLSNEISRLLEQQPELACLPDPR